MLSATFLDLTNDEIMTVGEVAVGDVYHGYCCDGYDWEVLLVFVIDGNPDHNSIWGSCDSPECCPRFSPDIGIDDPYQGVSSVLQCDFAEWLAGRAGGEMTNDLHEWKQFVDKSLARISLLASEEDQLKELNNLCQLTLDKITQRGWTGAGDDRIAAEIATIKRGMRRNAARSKVAR